MRLYKVLYDKWGGSQSVDEEWWESNQSDEGAVEEKWDKYKEKYVIAPAASVVCRKYEERDDTRFHEVELISTSVEEIDE